MARENQRNKLTTRPARSVKKVTKPKTSVNRKTNFSKSLGSGIKSPPSTSAAIARAGVSKSPVKPKAPISPRKPPTAKKPKTPTNVKPNVAGRAAAQASLASQRRTGGRENSGQAVAKKTTKPVKNRTSVKASQRSKKMK